MIKPHNETGTNIALIVIMIVAITLACIMANRFPPHKENIEIVKK